jgi:CRP-like cAMP-binding protein
MLPFISTIDVPAGTVVFRTGDASACLYLIVSGTFELRHPVANSGVAGAEHVAAVDPGALVGGLGMLGGQPRTATLVARDDGSLLTLSRADFDRLGATVPGLRDIAVDIVAEELVEAAHDADQDGADQWRQTAISSIEHLTRAEIDAAAEQHGAESSPLAIFIGALQDGIPESIAIGAGFTTLAAFSPTFMVAVFLSNLPEAVAGTSALLRARFSLSRVMVMWVGLVVGSAVAGAAGYGILHDASPAWEAFLGALAGGGVVAMLAMTMMPEAYESGRAGVAPATIIGFLASLLVAIFEIEVR